MDHSTHAHPLPDGRDVSRESSASNAIASSATPPHQDDYLNPQAKRLQLRNAGFRGPALPFRRISPLFGASSNAIEALGRSVNNENSRLSAEERTLYGEGLPYKPVNILQEIHNSTRKKKVSPRPNFCAIYVDDLEKEEVNDNASPTSWYNEGSDNCTPATLSGSQANMMKLREGSLNQRTPPPLSSPLAKHVNCRNSNQPGLRSASSEASKYIEHLEAQLASANARLESPSATRKRSTKLRALTVENRNLKHEVADWEKEFDARIQDERDQCNEAEMELRQHVKQLEEDMDLKNARIGELEWELESMRAKFRDANELKAMNVRLEKRIEVLTNILVQSPMKLDVCSATTSPQNPDPSKRNPRPKSMLPRMPSSPGGIQLSLDTVSESAFWQPKSIAAPASNDESTEAVSGEQDEQAFSLPMSEVARRSPDRIRCSRQAGFFDHRSQASTSYRSAPSTSSRPSSIRSSASFGPGPWGLPEPADMGPQSSSKRRRSMRRFPSGSNSLRPLVLPTSTVGPLLPATAPIYPSIETTASLGASGISLNPTTSFFSRPFDSSPTSTPTQPSHHRSGTWVQEQTLRALEGKLADVDCRENGLVPRPSPSDAGEPFMEFEEIPPALEKRKRRARPRSLEEELKEAHANQLRLAHDQADSSDSHEDGLLLVDRDDGSGHIMIGIDPTPSRKTFPNVSLMQRQSDGDDTPKPSKHVTPGLTSPRIINSPSSTTLTSEKAHGIFYRLISLITRTKQDPITLARRLLANAWALGSEWSGGMGWWLLGLVYGTRWRKRKRTADVGIAGENATQDFDWQQFSAEASRSRAADRYFRNQASTSARATGLTSPHLSQNTFSAQSTLSPPTSSPRKEPHIFPCPDCTEPSTRRTLRLWMQFSLAIVLALGLAIKNGPGTLLVSNSLYTYGPPVLKRRKQRTHSLDCADDASCPSRRSHDPGYARIVFAEILGPKDFEGR